MRNLIFLSMFGMLGVSCASLRPVTAPRATVAEKNDDRNIQFLDDIEMTPTANRPVQSSKTVYTPNFKLMPNGVEVAKTAPNRDLAANSIERFSSLQLKYAVMMDITVERLANKMLYDFIESWYGTRYRYGGTGRNGIDCSAFTQTLLSDVFGLSSERTARAQYAASHRIYRENLVEGDLVFFNTRGGVSHVGIYLQNGFFVHASSSKGVMISSLNDSYYDRRFIAGGRITH